MKALLVIDMQKDFTTGALGNPETAAVVAPVAKFIRDFRNQFPDAKIFATLDTHFPDYMDTQEGRNLPVPHCIKGSDGWTLEDDVKDALGDDCTMVEKLTFGAIGLPEIIGDGKDIEDFTVIGVCTDICVISNALILKAAYPEIPVKVKAGCCAGVTPESHTNALNAMKMCQIIVEE